MKLKIELELVVDATSNEANETVLCLDGTKLEGTGKTLQEAADNLKATMLSRLARLRREDVAPMK